MKISILTSALFVGLFFSAQAVAGGKLNDLEIAHAAYTADNIDIRYAHLALGMSMNPDVHKFAKTMIRDHEAVNAGALALLKKLKVQPQDNDFSRTLLKGADKNIAKFVTLTGKAFDCAYAKNELGYHQVVNKTVEGSWIPSVKVAPLKSFLKEALVTFKAHEDHAVRMVKKLKCN